MNGGHLHHRSYGTHSFLFDQFRHVFTCTKNSKIQISCQCTAIYSKARMDGGEFCWAQATSKWRTSIIFGSFGVIPVRWWSLLLCRIRFCLCLWGVWGIWKKRSGWEKRGRRVNRDWKHPLYVSMNKVQDCQRHHIQAMVFHHLVKNIYLVRPFDGYYHRAQWS